MRQGILGGFALALGVAAAAGAMGCIDVGHPAEIGCLADPNEPACPGARILDASRDTAANAGGDGQSRLDAGQEAARDGDTDSSNNDAGGADSTGTDSSGAD